MASSSPIPAPLHCLACFQIQQGCAKANCDAHTNNQILHNFHFPSFTWATSRAPPAEDSGPIGRARPWRRRTTLTLVNCGRGTHQLRCLRFAFRVLFSRMNPTSITNSNAMQTVATVKPHQTRIQQTSALPTWKCRDR